MRTSAVAVAAAGLLTAVLADEWDPKSTTTTKSAEPSTTVDAEWEKWDSSTTTTSKKPDATTSVDPNWSEWASSTTTTSKKPDPTTSADGANWGEWSTSSTTTSKKPAKSTSADPNWGEWSSSSTTTSKKPDPSTDASWGNWADGKSTTVRSTSTQWVTVTVYPNSDGAWSVWSDPATSKTTNTGVTTVTSTATKTSSVAESGWPAWDPATGQCVLNVVTSYGAPVWKPTPVIATSSSSAKSSSSSTEDWGVWSSSSSTTTTSKKADPTTSAGWGEWSSSSTTTTSKKPDPSSSTDANWGNWDGSSSTSTTTSKPVIVTSTSAESWGVWSTSTTTSSSKKASTTAAAGWSQSTSGISSNGNKFGMTYSPYTASGQCKDAATVAKDIAALAAKGFTSVRVYSTDCSTLENVGKAARDNKIKVILGVFISETGISGAQPQVDQIVQWAQWDLVELIVVGNEAVFQGRCSAGDLAWFISSSKKAFQAAGYKGAVTTTDELSVWQSQGSAWCDVVDIVSANLYAFFNADTTADQAGAFIQAEINDLAKICPGKDVYVMESGWPSAGSCNGKACPSPENQRTAITGIQQAVGAKVVFFSFEDEAWKQPGEFGVEQHWGCGSIFDGTWGSW